MRYGIAVGAVVEVACLIPFLIGNVGALVQPYMYGEWEAVLVTGTENISSFCSQLKAIYPNWTYYDPSTGEYVLNSTALPGGNIYIYLGSGAKLIIDKPLRVENTVQYPLPEPYPESELRNMPYGERGLKIYSQTVIVGSGSVDIVGTTVTAFQTLFKIQYGNTVNVINSKLVGVGEYALGWACHNPCDDPDFTGTGGCCWFLYEKSGVFIPYAYQLQGVTLEDVLLHVRGVTTVDTIYGTGSSTLAISTGERCPGGEVTINRILGKYEDVLDRGVVINNLLKSDTCHVEVTNGEWDGAVTLITTETNGNLVVKDTRIYASDENIRIEGDVTFINTSIINKTIPTLPIPPVFPPILPPSDEYSVLSFISSIYGILTIVTMVAGGLVIWWIGRRGG